MQESVSMHKSPAPVRHSRMNQEMSEEEEKRGRGKREKRKREEKKQEKDQFRLTAGGGGTEYDPLPPTTEHMLIKNSCDKNNAKVIKYLPEHNILQVMSRHDRDKKK